MIIYVTEYAYLLYEALGTHVYVKHMDMFRYILWALHFAIYFTNILLLCKTSGVQGSWYI